MFDPVDDPLLAGCLAYQTSFLVHTEHCLRQVFRIAITQFLDRIHACRLEQFSVLAGNTMYTKQVTHVDPFENQPFIDAGFFRQVLKAKGNSQTSYLRMLSRPCGLARLERRNQKR